MHPAAEFPAWNLFAPHAPSGRSAVRAEGFAALEGSGGNLWRWALGPEASLHISGVPLHGLRFRLRARASGHPVQIFWNGTRLTELAPAPASQQLELLLPGDVPEGTLLFLCEATPAKGDDRPLAFVVEAATLAPAFATKGRICPYPFSRVELPGDPFIPCCQSWLREEYFRLPAGEDPWNGPAAQALRASIHDGSYRYCHLDRCGMTLLPREDLSAHAADPGELPISRSNLAAALAGATELPEGPSAATLMGDARCNLACASCRPGKITALSKNEEPRLDVMLSLYDRYAPSLKIVKAAGDGEVFFSPALRRIVQEAHLLPTLWKVDVLTNGLLFDADALEALKPGSEKVRSVNVSLDAGDGETYQAIRGGDWNRLRRNLDWAAGERRRKRFDFLGLTFVLRAANFRSLPAFLELAEALEADEVYVSQLFPWERMRISYREEAVHEAGHPEHAAFRSLWAAERTRPRRFRWRTNLP